MKAACRSIEAHGLEVQSRLDVRDLADYLFSLSLSSFAILESSM